MAFDSKLSNIGNLVDALQLVCWDLAQTQIKDAELNRLRNAVIGIGDGLEKLVAEST